jgi:hypothetical protein
MESKSIEADITGRVMALEQKLRGLQGRVSALEMRLSMETPGACQISLYDGMEFVSGEPSRQHAPDISVLEGRLSSMEATLLNKKADRADKKNLALDLTGLIIGLAMIAIGVLLSTNSFDILRNPLLAFGAGIAILACVALRIIIK